VLGVDLAVKPLRVAQLHAMEQGIDNLEYREVAAEALAAEQPSSFDLVTCMEMLEHVPKPALVVHAVAALAKPGATVFFSTINRNPKAFAFAIVGAEHVLKLLPKGTHEYAKFIKPSELAQWCREAGLELLRMRGLTYNPFTKRYALGDDTSVNYMMACRKSPS
jgi:2-polyprenyl-6-hydroxyphenyl methylase / 3-demethylubiquinone-9 3-methyltransferase